MTMPFTPDLHVLTIWNFCWKVCLKYTFDPVRVWNVSTLFKLTVLIMCYVGCWGLGLNVTWWKSLNQGMLKVGYTVLWLAEALVVWLQIFWDVTLCHWMSCSWWFEGM
jgi:hypothetical protein